MLLSYLIMFVAIAAVVVLAWDRIGIFSPRDGKSPAPSAVSKKQDSETIQEMLKALSEKYDQQKKSRPALPPADPWTSRTLTLSLLGFSCVGQCSRAEATEQYAISRLSGALSRSGRITLVEREKISRILDELQLSASDIADQVGAPVMLGKLLGAQLICAGKVVRIKGDHSLNLRVFETETSRIVISIAEPFNDKNRSEAIDRLAQSLVREITALYPLRGKIARVKQEEIILNIGAAAGVTPGSVFAVLSDATPFQMEGKTLGYDEQKIGTIKTVTAEKNLARCAIVKQTTPFREGARVVELAE